MKKLLEKMIAMSLVILLVFSMASCGVSTSNQPSPSASAEPPNSSQSPAPNDVSSPAPSPVTIQFANSAVLEAGYEGYWTNVKKTFESAYPHVTLEYVVAPYGEIFSQVVNMAGAGNSPDIFLIDLPWLHGLTEAGLAVPADTIVSKELIGDIQPNVLAAHTIDEELRALPLIATTYVLYYNRDLFTQAGLDPNSPPKTYEEAMAMSEKLSKLKTPEGNKVYAFGQTTASVPVSGSALTSMILTMGGEVLSADRKLSVDNDGFRQTFETLKKMHAKGYVPENAKLKDLRNLFALGQLAMYYDETWGFAGISAINPDAASFTSSTIPLTGGSGSSHSQLAAQSIVFLKTPADDAKKQALDDFVQFISSEESLGDYLGNYSVAFPARKSLAGMKEITDNPVVKGAASALNKAIAPPSVPEMNNLYLELCTLAQSVTVGGKSFDEALTTFKSAAEDIIN